MTCDGDDLQLSDAGSGGGGAVIHIHIRQIRALIFKANKVIELPYFSVASYDRY